MSTVKSNRLTTYWLSTCFCDWTTRLVTTSVVILLFIQLAIYKEIVVHSNVRLYKQGSLDDLKSTQINRNISYVKVKNQTNEILTIQYSEMFHNIRTFTVVGNNRYFIYSVHGEISLQNKQWTSIVFNGWEVVETVNQLLYVPYICCLKYKNGIVRTSSFSGARSYQHIAVMHAKQIVCDLKNGARPEFAALVLEQKHCYKSTSYYRPEYKQIVQEPKFAINAKIAYGKKDAGELIEFMEYHLHFGASPIIIYQYYDLPTKIRKVLNYYMKRGDLEVITFPKVPLQERYRRRFEEPCKLTLNDEQITNFDAQQRLRYYKYYAFIDTDEFIVPGKKNTDFLQLMRTLVEKHKNAAKFRMLSEIHLRDWESTNNKSRLLIGRYGYHTEPTEIANKQIHISVRMVPGTVRTHNGKPKKGYKSIKLKKEEAVLKHFRFCKRTWTTLRSQCRYQFKKLRGHFMNNIAEKITEKVLHVKQITGIE